MFNVISRKRMPDTRYQKPDEVLASGLWSLVSCPEGN